MGGSRGKRHRGLGELQKNQREDTDRKVYHFLTLCYRGKTHVSFSEIMTNLRIDATVLRKSLNRLIQDREVEEYRLISWQKDRLGRHHAVHYKGFRIIDYCNNPKQLEKYIEFVVNSLS